ncbi:hypothetical protein STEG23_020154, partial [Scotinomys teguina]
MCPAAYQVFMDVFLLVAQAFNPSTQEAEASGSLADENYGYVNHFKLIFQTFELTSSNLSYASLLMRKCSKKFITTQFHHPVVITECMYTQWCEVVARHMVLKQKE